MRINVYSQEITGEVLAIEKVSNTGITYRAVQMVLHSSDRLHHPPEDDDRSAVTFWIPKSPNNRALLSSALRQMAHLVDAAEPETN